MNFKNNFLKPAGHRFWKTKQYAGLNPHSFRVLAVSAEHFRHKKACFVAAGSGADFHNHVFAVVLVLGAKAALQFRILNLKFQIQVSGLIKRHRLNSASPSASSFWFSPCSLILNS